MDPAAISSESIEDLGRLHDERENRDLAFATHQTSSIIVELSLDSPVRIRWISSSWLDIVGYVVLVNTAHANRILAPIHRILWKNQSLSYWQMKIKVVSIVLQKHYWRTTLNRCAAVFGLYYHRQREWIRPVLATLLTFKKKLWRWTAAGS